jgi:hypothetical protein
VYCPHPSLCKKKKRRYCCDNFFSYVTREDASDSLQYFCQFELEIAWVKIDENNNYTKFNYRRGSADEALTIENKMYEIDVDDGQISTIYYKNRRHGRTLYKNFDFDKKITLRTIINIDMFIKSSQKIQNMIIQWYSVQQPYDMLFSVNAYKHNAP